MAEEPAFNIKEPLSTQDIADLEGVVSMADDAIPTIEQAINAGLDVETQLDVVKQSRDQAQRLLTAFRPKRRRVRKTP